MRRLERLWIVIVVLKRRLWAKFRLSGVRLLRLFQLLDPLGLFAGKLSKLLHPFWCSPFRLSFRFILAKRYNKRAILFGSLPLAFLGFGLLVGKFLLGIYNLGILKIGGVNLFDIH